MAGPLHRIEIDPETGIVEAHILGFWTAAHVAVFGRELRAAFKAARDATGRDPVLLSNSVTAAIQSPDVVEAMRLLGEELAPWPRKTALLTEGQLRMQAKRIIAASTGTAAFNDRAKAIAWLLADG